MDTKFPVVGQIGGSGAALRSILVRKSVSETLPLLKFGALLGCELNRRFGSVAWRRRC